MRTTSQLLLTFLLNACWQVALIGAVASVGAWLLRKTAARCRHLLWVVALVISFGLPVLTCSQLLGSIFFPARTPPQTATTPRIAGLISSPQLTPADLSAPVSDPNPSIQVNRMLAAGLVALYFLFLTYRSVKLFRAWWRTKAIKHSARTIELLENAQAIIDRCQNAIGVTRFRLLCSASVPVPITIGIRNPLVILPEQLLREADADVLTSAVGHEMVHVRRRDYFLNLLYELIYLPLSFHPAAALVRRRINQTRELGCDELVTEKLLAAEVYARSLVRLAGSAAPFGRPATLTVGITDADILEVRIMSLLSRPKTNPRRNKLLLIAVSLLLAAPCVAAARFGFGFDITPQDASMRVAQESGISTSQHEDRKARLIFKTEPEYTEDARAKKIEGIVVVAATIDPKGLVQDVQVTKPLYPSLDQSAVETVRKWRFEPSLKDGQPASKRISIELVFNLNAWQQDKEKGDRAREEQESKERAEREDQELKERIERETNSEVRAKLEAALRKRQEQREAAQKKAQFLGREVEVGTRGYAVTLQGDGEGWRAEREVEARQKVELARAAKITMDQAIQIAISQEPGKVLECSLNGEHWEAPGKLGKESQVFYHVVILAGDEANPATTHVLVSAIDGQVIKTEKEERKKEKTRRQEP